MSIRDRRIGRRWEVNNNFYNIHESFRSLDFWELLGGSTFFFRAIVSGIHEKKSQQFCSHGLCANDYFHKPVQISSTAKVWIISKDVCSVHGSRLVEQKGI